MAAVTALNIETALPTEFLASSLAADDVNATTISPPLDVASESYDVSNERSDLLFQSANITMGFVGTLSNGFIVLVLISEFQQNKQQATNILLLNQLVLDLYSSIWLTATYSVKICHLWLTGSIGYWLCQLVISEAFLWVGLEGSMLNIAAIAIERYLKICHPLWHKAHFRSYMVYFAVSFIWVSSAVVSFASVIPTTDIVDGECLVQLFWQSTTAVIAFGIWFYLSYYIIQIVICTFCYGKIFVVIRYQQKIFPGNSSRDQHPTNFDTPQQKKTHIKLLKTAFLLTLSYAISWLPCHTLFLLMNLQVTGANLSLDVWYGTVFFAFSNIVCNPFIYGTKSDVVKNVLRTLLSRCCNRCYRKSEEREIQMATNISRVNTMNSTQQRF